MSLLKQWFFTLTCIVWMGAIAGCSDETEEIDTAKSTPEVNQAEIQRMKMQSLTKGGQGKTQTQQMRDAMKSKTQ